MRTLQLALICVLSAVTAVAAPTLGTKPSVPPTLAAHGLALGMSQSEVAALLARDYRACSADQSIYQTIAGDVTRHIAALSINPGLTAHDVGSLDTCTFSPAGDGITDSIEARFAHKDIDPRQPLYSISITRVYPDAVHGGPGSFRKPFDAVRKDLVRSYGRPVDERREKLPSAAGNLASSLGVGKLIKRQDVLVRYLWTTDGRLADIESEGSTCRCSHPFAKAVIEISRALSNGRDQRDYTTSVAISIVDPALKARQDEWNSQWQRAKR